MAWGPAGLSWLTDGLAVAGPGGFPAGHLVRIGHERGGEVEVKRHGIAVEAELLGIGDEVLGAEFVGNLRKGRVSRQRGSLSDGNATVRMVLVVGDGRVADIKRAWRAVDGVRRNRVRVERGAERDDLEGRARCVERLRRAVDERSLRAKR